MLGTQRIGVLLVVALAIGAFGGCAGLGSDKAGSGPGHRRPVVTLTLAFFTGEDEIDGFVSEVKRLSGGSIEIDVKTNWRWGQVNYENGLIADVRAGKADIGVVGSRAWDSVGVDSFRALGAPLLINSYALQARVLASPLVARMLGGMSPLGLDGIGVLPGPLRHPAGIVRPLLGPSDYSGLRIGTQQSLVAGATLRALGATPVWFPAGGPPPRVDGVEQEISSIQGPLYRRVSYVTANVVLWPRPLVVFANERAFAKLTPAQRRILVEAAAADDAPQTKFERGTERVDAATMCRARAWRFVTASDADVTALRRAVQPVYTNLERDPATRREIAQIDAMAPVTAPEPAPSCAQSAATGAQPGLLDGVYQYSVTLADLKAAGADPTELTASNIGKTTFLIDRGAFAMTIVNPKACVRAFGTLRVSGDKLITYFFSYGGGGPGATPNVFTFYWSLYRDLLTLRRVPGATSPTNAIAKPWRRVSITPSLRYFSKACPPPTNTLPR
jgi:TRAP-type C4-dicarboxylate transport system substrate-binding protein